LLNFVQISRQQKEVVMSKSIGFLIKEYMKSLEFKVKGDTLLNKQNEVIFKNTQTNIPKVVNSRSQTNL
jgi:hypothetical protein